MQQAHFKKPAHETTSCYLCGKKIATETTPIMEDTKTTINVPVCQFCNAILEEADNHD